MWTQAHRATYRQSGAALPSDLTDGAVGASGAVDPGREVRGAAAHDGQARGDEHNLLSPTHMALREALDREASPTAAILDSQSLKAGEGGEPRAGVKRTQWVTTPARR
jgi:hypothetical protein